MWAPLLLLDYKLVLCRFIALGNQPELLKKVDCIHATNGFLSRRLNRLIFRFEHIVRNKNLYETEATGVKHLSRLFIVTYWQLAATLKANLDLNWVWNHSKAEKCQDLERILAGLAHRLTEYSCLLRSSQDMFCMRSINRYMSTYHFSLRLIANIM